MYCSQLVHIGASGAQNFNMNILVIGANGFLGRHIAKKAVDNLWHVWGTYRSSREHIPKQCSTIHITQLSNLRVSFDAVFLSVGNFSMGYSDLFESNLAATTNASKRFPSTKLIYISSIAVYGSPRGAVDEHTAFYNPGMYGHAKIAGEFVAKGHARYSIIRFTHLYGIGMHLTSLIPTLIRDALEKSTITLYGDTRRKKDYLHVEDAAGLAIKAALSENNDVYLGATGKSTSILTIARIIQKHITHTKIVAVPGETLPSYRFDPACTMAMLSWKPKKSLESSLGELITYYAKNST